MAASAKWQLLLTDLTGAVHGEIVGAKDLKVSNPLMRVPQCSFTVPLWHTWASTMMDTDCLVKAYRTDPVTGTKTLMFHGPVVTGHENAAGTAQTISVTSAGPLWRLSKRIIPGSDVPTGLTYPASGEMSLGLIAHYILDSVNGASNGMTGIKKNPTITGTIPNGRLAAGNLKNAGEALAELSAGLNSFEFDIVPTEPETTGQANAPYIGTMNVASTIGFVSRNDAVFEYSGGHRGNITSYERIVSREGLMTKGYIASDVWRDPSTAHPLQTSTSDNVTTRGLFEDVVPDGSLRDNAVRTLLLNEHIMVRKNPKQVIIFTVAPGVRPSPGLDYFLGDFVRARAVVRGSVRFDAMFRVWGITYSLGDSGNEQIELELTPP